MDTISHLSNSPLPVDLMWMKAEIRNQFLTSGMQCSLSNCFQDKGAMPVMNLSTWVQQSSSKRQNKIKANPQISRLKENILDIKYQKNVSYTHGEIEGLLF